MTDIVERLRAMPSSLNDALRTMEEAADEISRLRSGHQLTISLQWRLDEIIERLRNAGL